MQALHEALAREHCSELHRQRMDAELASVARALAAQRRWHRVARFAHAAEQRHARRVESASSR